MVGRRIAASGGGVLLMVGWMDGEGAGQLLIRTEKLTRLDVEIFGRLDVRDIFGYLRVPEAARESSAKCQYLAKQSSTSVKSPLALGSTPSPM